MSNVEAIRITPQPAPEIIRLDMSVAEAEVLATVCTKIGGWTNGSRGVTDHIHVVLSGCGVHADRDAAHGSIRFADGSAPQ